MLYEHMNKHQQTYLNKHEQQIKKITTSGAYETIIFIH